jgi:iron complex outermembrane receptor protein
MIRKLLLASSAAGLLSVGAGAAQAATATATATGNAAATDQSATTVADIVVRTERRETKLQKVPVAVSVFTGAQRDTIGINTVADVTNFAPGFTYDPATVHAYLRGVGRQSVNVTDDQRVSNYEDEFYVYSPYGLAKSSLFLSQEQIERGPQNIGGRNAAAGSIDMISVRPTEQPYAELRASVGNFGAYHVEGAASGQIAPGLTGRIAGFWDDQEQGYYKNLLGGPSEGHVVKEWYSEGQVDWKPNDRFELWARAFAEGWNNRGDAGSRVGPDVGSWDETALTDGNDYVAGGLFINPTFGYAAASGGNPAAAAALLAAQAAGDQDPQPTSVTLVNPHILDNPASVHNPNVFVSQIPRTVKLAGYDDFNFIATYHASGFDIKYNAGVQGYNYYLNDPGDGPEESANNVKQFSLPGNTSFGIFNTAFGGGAFPGCAACGLGGTPLPAATPLNIGQLVINPQIHANYVEDDWWTAHDLTFQSTTDAPFQWTVGVFGYYQHYNQPYRVYDNNQPQLTTPFYSPPIPGALISVTDPTCAALGGLCGFSFDPAFGGDPGTPAPANPDHTIGYFDYKFNVMSFGGYAQGSYKINDQLKVTGDLRYSWDRKWGDETSRYLFFGSGIIDPFQGVLGPSTPALDITPSQTCLTGNPANCNSGPLAPGVKKIGMIMPNGYATRELEIRSDALTGGAEIEWTPSPSIFTYARYGRGYESPSFNAGQVIALPATKPEFLNAYEIGYKQTFGRGLLVDVAAFYYDYLGLQVPLSIANGGVIENLFVNVPKSVSEGIELEVYWTPIRDLSFTFSYSYDQTKVLSDCTGTVSGGVLTPNANALCLEDTNDPEAVAPGAKPFPGQDKALGPRLQSIKGDQLPNAPLNKLAVDGAYTFHFEPGDLTFSATFAFRDSQVASLFGRFYDTAPSWYDVDLRALWKGPNDRYEIIAYVKNVTNTLQYTVAGGGSGLFGSASAVNDPTVGLNWVKVFDLNPPRTFGLEVRYKFF